MLSVSAAQQQILERTRVLPGEVIATEQALGRIAARDVRAEKNLPALDNSAMDGYAVRAADTPGSLPVVGTARAGGRPGAPLAPGAAIRIMTGAPLPIGADAVVIQEEVRRHGQVVEIPIAVKLGDHVRRAGEDVSVGNIVIERGTELGAGEIGLLAALNLAEVEAIRRPRVAVLATGDELVPLGVACEPGQLVSSSSYALEAQIHLVGGLIHPLGVVPDDRGLIAERIRDGLSADVLLTTGGVSVGEYDFVREALADTGVSLEFWKVAMKPGKPLAFGIAPTGTLVFGLPGNPVSTMVAFELFVRPALRALQAARQRFRPQLPVVMEQPYEKPPGRTHYLRARLDFGSQPPIARLARHQGSGTLSSMIGVDVLVEIAAELTRVEAGQSVPGLLIKWT